MDGRTLALMTAGLLGVLGGCTHTSPLTKPDPMTAPLAVDDSGALKHKAPTFCAFGDMIAGAAFQADKTPDERRQARNEAKLSYLKAIETDPKYVPAYVSLARIQQAGEEYADAVASFHKAIQLAPTTASLWYDLGLCQCRMKQWEDSIASFKKAVELSPGNRSYMGTLGYTLGRAGKVQESLVVLTQANGEAKANYDLARLMRHMNQLQIAKQLAAAAVEKDPNLPGAKELLEELNGGRGAVIHATAFNKSAQPGQAPPPPAIIQATTTTEVTGQPTLVETAATFSANQSEGLSGKSIKLPPLPVVNPKK